MKAKVISTGKIVEVEYGWCHDIYNEKVFLDCNEELMSYFESDLEFIDEHEQHNTTAKTIDWEQRRFELVKVMLPQAVKLYVQANSTDEPNLPKRFNGMNVHQICSQIAVEYADAVIAKLKDESV